MFNKRFSPLSGVLLVSIISVAPAFAPAGEPQSYAHKCVHIKASEAALTLKSILGEPPAGAKELAYSLSIDARSNTVQIMGPANKITLAKAVLGKLDVSSEGHIVGAITHEFYVYFAPTGDAKEFVKKLQEKYRGSKQFTRIEALGTKEIMVYAPLVEQDEIRQFIEKVAPAVLELTPATEPRPALKFSLLPELRDQIPGNAALCYQRALLRLKDRKEKLPEKAN